jgi:hypothetical protein
MAQTRKLGSVHRSENGRDYAGLNGITGQQSSVLALSAREWGAYGALYIRRRHAGAQ